MLPSLCKFTLPKPKLRESGGGATPEIRENIAVGIRDTDAFHLCLELDCRGM